MIRANLLPRARSVARLFGVRFDVELVREIVVLTGVVLAVALATALVQGIRLASLDADERRAQTIVATHDAERARAERVAFDVARLEVGIRRARELRASGDAAARAIVRLGDAVPAGVALDAVTDDRGEVRLRGRALSLGRIGATIASLDRRFPGRRADLGDVAENGGDGTLGFTLIVGAIPPPHAASPGPAAEASP